MRKYLAMAFTTACFIAGLYTGDKVRTKYLKGN